MAPIDGRFTVVTMPGGIYWPDQGQNTIGTWQNTGYRIQIVSPCCLPVYGDSLTNQMLSLSIGMNHLPVLTNENVYIDRLFNGQLEKVSSITDIHTLETWKPDYHKFNILEPGSAYIAFVSGNSPLQIEYPDYDTPLHVSSLSLNLSQGWNGVSLFIDPYNSQVQDIFAPVSSSVEIMKDLWGGVYWPQQGINTITGWNYTTAYALKVNAPVNLEFPGVVIDFIPATVSMGWNYFPVHTDCPVNTMELFSPFEEDIIIVKELVGTKVWWPSQNIYSLEELEPGKGYELKSDIPFEVEFPACLNQDYSQPLKSPNYSVSNWGRLVYTPASHIISIPADIIERFSSGDQLGVFDNSGACYGSLIISSVKPEALIVFGNDPSNETKDGFNEEESMIFRYLDYSTQQATVIEVVLDEQLPDPTPQFANHGLSAIRDIRFNPSATSELIDETGFYIYPNPAQNEIFIGLNPEPLNCISEIYDILGNKILSFRIVMKKSRIDISGLGAGMYFIKLRINDKVFTKRMVFIE